MSEIRVENVIRLPNKKPVEVGIMAGNVLLSFAIVNGRVKLVSKSKPEARVYDSAQLDVPKNLFAQACRRAAEILYSQP